MPLFGPPDVAWLAAHHNIKRLTKALNYRQDSGVRLRAVLALKEIGDAQAIDALVAALAHKLDDVPSE